jgi:drug/metabolite transporter (DMT)-like permease
MALGQANGLRTRNPGWHVFRSCLAVVLLPAIFYGLNHIPLAEFIAIIFAAPFFVAILTPILLRERVAGRAWLAIGMGFCGILIVTRPTPDHFHIAHLTTLFCAASTATLSVTARRLAVTESMFALNFYLYPAIILVYFLPTVWGWQTPTPLDWGLFAALGFTATAALWCVIIAVRHAKPAVIAPIDYIRIVWTIAVGWLFWDEIPDAMTWLGILVIAACGLYIVTHGRRDPTR